MVQNSGRVLQGCVLSPLLFNIFLEAIIAMVLEDAETGELIGGEMFSDLRFADDIALLAEVVNGFSSDNVVALRKMTGMRINTAKTKTQYLGTGTNRFCLQADGQQLQQTWEGQHKQWFRR
jgi:hypothetical protein